MALKKKKRSQQKKVSPVRNKFSSCLLCRKRPELVEPINQAWLDGQEPQELSKHFGIKLSAIKSHLHRCVINKHRSRYDRLKVLLDNLFEDIDIARQVFQDVGDGESSSSYQGLLREFRGILGDLQKVQSADQQIDEIVELVINPLIVRLTQIIAKEAGSLRDELAIRMDALEAESTVKEFTDTLGEQFNELTPDLREQLESVLSAKDKNRKHVLGGKSDTQPTSTFKN